MNQDYKVDNFLQDCVFPQVILQFLLHSYL